MFLLSGLRMIHLDTRWVWRVLLIGIGVAFLLEWLYWEASRALTAEKPRCSQSGRDRFQRLNSANSLCRIQQLD
jgi:hypothetical protein